MSWEIVAGIITLAGAFAGVGGIVFKLSRIFTSLEATMKALDDTLQELKATNTESHKFLHKRIDEHAKSIDNHERRITVLECHDKGNRL